MPDLSSHSRTFSVPKVLLFRLRFYFRLWNVTREKNRRPNEIERVENVHFICHKFSRLRFHFFFLFCALWTARHSRCSRSPMLILCAAQPGVCVCVCVKIVYFSILALNIRRVEFGFFFAFSGRKKKTKKTNQPLLRDKMFVCTSVFALVHTDIARHNFTFHFATPYVAKPNPFNVCRITEQRVPTECSLKRKYIFFSLVVLVCFSRYIFFLYFMALQGGKKNGWIPGKCTALNERWRSQSVETI